MNRTADYAVAVAAFKVASLQAWALTASGQDSAAAWDRVNDTIHVALAAGYFGHLSDYATRFDCAQTASRLIYLTERSN